IEIDHTRIGNFDLGLVVEQQSDRLRASLVHNAELFDADTIEHMAAAFRLLLSGIIANADRPVIRLPLVEGGAQPLAGLQPHPTAPADIGPLLARQTQATPNNQAVIGEGSSLSYRGLEERANQLARYFQAMGVGSDIPMAIFLDRSTD